MSVIAVTRLELRRLFVRPLAWVLAALTLAQLAWRFTLLLGGFLAGQIKLAALPGGPGYTDLVGVPMLSSLLTGSALPFGVAELALVIVPLLTMSVIAGERSNGTLPLWFAAGLPASRIVLGKYLALMLWLVVWLALALAMPLSLAHGVTLDWGKLAAASLGLLLTLAALAAIGVACSAYASHASIAASVALTLGLVLAGVNIAAQKAGATNGVFNWLSLSSHLESLLRGLVSTADVAWFLIVIGVALALATQRLAAERERG
ncbi:ABC transporter permease [Dyella jiangningensis]|uniref:ABC transporter permease n=1 Tax=Dyella jiangningensis TaxID=1379159 RepID=UPI00045621AD|nr:ABC transporter permease subunit [Dyella jiangningensis]AHX15035.1 ABC transporter permease [Dyella jiangningensis]MDG2538485.1 ABC transporter permease subunit [Dyella jiangningensis]